MTDAIGTSRAEVLLFPAASLLSFWENHGLLSFDNRPRWQTVVGGSSAYVAATMGDRVVQFDARTLELLRSLDVGGEPDGLGSTPVIPRAVCHGCTPLENPQQGLLRRNKFEL